MNQEISNSSNQLILDQQPSRSMGFQAVQEEHPYRPSPSSPFKAILFEILFVLILLILIFGTLNYFNILRLSELFPNQLGFLPHQREVPTGTSQSNNIAIPPAATPTVSLTDQRGYSLVPSQAKQTLLEFLPTILAPSLLPSSSDISLTQNKGLVESISASWNTQEGTLSAVLVVSPNSKNVVQLYLSLMQAENVPPSIKLASTTISNLFSVKPKGTWGCKPLYNNSMTYCENFWEEKDGTRRGLGMEGLFTQGVDLISGKPEVMLVFCEHGKESKIYSWKSCSFEFKERGVK